MCGFLQNLRMSFYNTKDAPLSVYEKALAVKTYKELDVILKKLDTLHMNAVNMQGDDITKDMRAVYDKRLLPYVAECLEIVEEATIADAEYEDVTAVMGMHTA